jgi:DNA phosphorothioation-associated putative methyltransferase
MSVHDIKVRRERTAIRRAGLSRPVRLAIEDGIINPQTPVFDYGCGHGDDLRYLSSLGIPCSGWDPAFAPAEERSPADVVNLGYVINVIEDPRERAHALEQAWKLTRRVLIVSARLSLDISASRASSFADGFITGKGTFQKLFEQQELRGWIDTALGTQSLAVAPGIFYVFRDGVARESYSAARFRRPASVIHRNRTELLIEQFKPEFDQLAAFVSQRGRFPELSECPAAQTLADKIGSLKRAVLILKRTTDETEWERVRSVRAQDLLVYLALSRFPKRPKFAELPESTKLDIKAFFANYTQACQQADELLFSAGKPAIVDNACRAARVGKLTGDALYVHESALADLPSVLRVYEGCARVLVGRVEGGNIVKLHRFASVISYVSYPQFEKVAHPPLVGSLIVDLQSLRVRYRDYSTSPNRPILHRKEEFVPVTHPLRAKFAKLTRQEEQHGLFAKPERIGYEDGWKEALSACGIRLAGHRLLRKPGPPKES